MYLEDVTEGTAPAGGNNMGKTISTISTVCGRKCDILIFRSLADAWILLSPFVFFKYLLFLFC